MGQERILRRTVEPSESGSEWGRTFFYRILVRTAQPATSEPIEARFLLSLHVASACVKRFPPQVLHGWLAVSERLLPQLRDGLAAAAAPSAADRELAQSLIFAAMHNGTPAVLRMARRISSDPPESLQRLLRCSARASLQRQSRRRSETKANYIMRAHV